MDFLELWQFAPAIAGGLAMTLGLCAIASSTGLALGTTLAVGERFAGRWASPLVSCYVELFRNTPLLVQLMWIHFALPLVTGVSTSPRVSAIIGLALGAIAISIEIVRAGLMAIPRGQWEAASALGLRKSQALRLVALPQALRAMLPAITNMVLSLLRGTTVVSILAVGELVQVASRISNYTFKPVEIYSLIAIIYLLVGFLIDQSGRVVERRLALRMVR